ncbi:hypothetical protein OIU77_005997 [Salix suchowensis]|uniref:Uncharacterized protein n=1 Tax=Salix suchowensis TaxID=1278906 RepID=A0ABQ9ARE6_9ROSI|nr:hypothetical protein OIU77_005997 [Salix suchowensis]
MKHGCKKRRTKSMCLKTNIYCSSMLVAGKRVWSCRNEYLCSILELRLKTFRWYLSIEPLSVCAVVVDHVVITDPLHFTQLGAAQLAIRGGCPPVSCGVGSTLIYANRSIPLASPCPKSAVSCNEGCSCPINLNSPTLSCPVISIPQAGSHVCWVKYYCTYVIGCDSSS